MQLTLVVSRLVAVSQGLTAAKATKVFAPLHHSEQLNRMAECFISTRLIKQHWENLCHYLFDITW